MIRLLRHDDTVHREDDGAARFDDLIEKFKVKFGRTSQWTDDAWTSFLAKGRRTETKVSVLLQTLILPNISCISEESRDIQEVLSLILHCKTMYCFQNDLLSTSTTSGI